MILLPGLLLLLLLLVMSQLCDALDATGLLFVSIGLMPEIVSHSSSIVYK